MDTLVAPPDRVVAELREALRGRPSSGEPRFEAFVTATLEQVPNALLGSRPAAVVASALEDAWRFVLASDTDRPCVGVSAKGDALVVHVAAPDQPFLLDTVRLGLRARGATRIDALHVIVRPTAVARLDVRGLAPELADSVRADLLARLSLARAMVGDFDTMRVMVESFATQVTTRGDDGAEAAAFLRWLLADNFVFIGITAGTTRLGADSVEADTLWPSAVAERPETPLAYRKCNHDAPVHRAGRADAFHVALNGDVAVLRGLFTHRALAQSCRSVPLLRRRLAHVLVETRQRPNSHRYRGLANLFDALPTEWLLAATPEALHQVLDQVFDADEAQAAQLHLHQQDGGATTFTIVAIPERRYGESVRAGILARLTEATAATYTDSGLFAGRFDTALLRVYQTGTRPVDAGTIAGLRTCLLDLTSSWAERAGPAVAAHFGTEASVLLARYGDSFPVAYAARVSPAQAVADLEALEACRRGGATLARIATEGEDIVLRVVQATDLLLTELMPVLDAFGLVVSEQFAVEVRPRGAAPLQIDHFRVVGVQGAAASLAFARGDKLVAGLEAVFRNDVACDGFHRLALRADLDWQEVDLVRAYLGYARQLGLRIPPERVQAFLCAQADAVAAIVRAFHARFDPALSRGTVPPTGGGGVLEGTPSAPHIAVSSQGSAGPAATDLDRDAAVASADTSVATALAGIPTRDEDLLLRTLANLVESTVRTNFYRDDRVGHYLSLKIEHARVKSMPEPRLRCEIYVHHREMEGVHLRGGKVARGGIRSSDRGDVRTEVLGLVATQMVKNVVIVPVGSKGGFTCTRALHGLDEQRCVGDVLYGWFIRGLLDVTDTIVDGRVVHPPRVVAHDGEDPYLVVAADKGTAHLSDTANALSRTYGYWLDDAFASGGSQGYDHKAMGITARGAWVLVRRHFHELGLDPDRDRFTCAGIGDCGGDVFGNGVLESPRMKLVAAFNHRHIFLDPDPDLARSHAERARLFREVRGWEAYDPAVLSAGGGVFERTARSLPLSPEVRALLGVTVDALPPEEVIRAILTLPVDLLWNGGIGTYVRATHETNADAQDPANDAVRIPAASLRARVVGEGGNLGFTQAARVEVALAGCRLNTDFVDNSGGVDTSDHEVNIKILLQPRVARGALTMDARNALVRSLTDEVARAVLADNDSNGRLISLDVLRSRRDPVAFRRAMDWVCEQGRQTRSALILPSDEELQRRSAREIGLVRPEVATLQAHVRLHVGALLRAEDLSGVPGLTTMVRDYFPAPLRGPYAEDIAGHMLAREIGATMLLSRVVTDAGSVWFPRMLECTGRSAGMIAGAWMQALEVTGAAAFRPVGGGASWGEGALRAWLRVSEALSDLVARWLMPDIASDAAHAVLPDMDAPGFAAALDALVRTRPPSDANEARALATHLVALGVPAAQADAVTALGNAVLAHEVGAMALARDENLDQAAVRLQAVGHATGLLRVLRTCAEVQGQGRWGPVAMGIQRIRTLALLRDLAVGTDLRGSADTGVDALAHQLANGPLGGVARIYERVVGAVPDVAGMLVAEQQVRSVLGRGALTPAAPTPRPSPPPPPSRP